MATKTKDFREMSPDELGTARRDMKEEALHLRIQKESGQIENPARIHQIRRDIARIETILSEKRNAEASN